MLLEATWQARRNLLEVLEARPPGLSPDAQIRYEGFVAFVQGLFADLVWHFRACEGYGRLTDEERETLEAEVFVLPVCGDGEGAVEWEVRDEPAEQREFTTAAASLWPALTADQRYYLFRAWQLTRRIGEAVNTPLDLLDDDEKAQHERRVREQSHQHVQMRGVLASLGEALRLSGEERCCIDSLLQVHFEE